MHAVEALHDGLLDLVDDLGALAGHRVDLVDPLVVDLNLEVAGPAAVAAQPVARVFRVFAHRSDSMLPRWATRDASRELLALDRAHVWHPYGPMPAAAAPLLVVGARGVRLTLADGRELIDGMSSWWCAIHGYRHPVLDAAARGAAGAHVARDVRRPDARAGDRAGAASGGADPGAARARLLRRLRLGRRRGRDQDLPAGGRARTRAPAGAARRLPRRHLRRDVGLRPGRRACTTCFASVLPAHLFAPRPPGGVDAAPRRALRGRTACALRRPRRRARGRDRRAGGPGRGRHVVLLAGLPARCCASSATRTACC